LRKKLALERPAEQGIALEELRCEQLKGSTPRSQDFDFLFPKPSSCFSTSLLCQHNLSNQIAILSFLSVQILSILQSQVQNASHFPSTHLAGNDSLPLANVYSTWHGPRQNETPGLYIKKNYKGLVEWLKLVECLPCKQKALNSTPLLQNKIIK
jgi:hypothetical protein